MVPLLEDSLSRDFSRQRVGKAAFAGDDDRKNGSHLVTKAMRFVNGRVQVRQMLEHVDGQQAIEVAVGKVEPLLAVAGDGVDAGGPPLQCVGHVWAQLYGVIVAFGLV